MLLSLDVLGPLAIAFDAKPVALESAKVRALLVFLALEADKPHPRDELIGLLWAELPEAHARRNLRHALWNLNQRLTNPLPVLLTTRETVQFNPTSDAQVDALEFRALLAACRSHAHRAIETCRPCIGRLERAVALYRGELLHGFFAADAPAFEEWLLLRREQFQRLVITALHQITAYYEQMGEAGFAETERYAHRHIELEAWSEEPYRALMRMYAAQHQTEQAVAVYHMLANALHQELDLEPSAETLALYKHLVTRSSEPSRRSPSSTLQASTSNLPPPATPLVGRETELAQLAEKITRTDCRLLTLVGQGGIGKTRLALETARANRQAFPRGVYFVDLADLDTPEMIPHAIADALQVQFRGSATDAQQLVEFLRAWNEPGLLLLDNFEQIINGASFVSEMLKRAPQLSCLVTSREPLNVDGEWLFPVEGLHVADALPAQVQDDWDASDAMQLLVQCAARANVDARTWKDDEKRAAMRLTQLVEGLPLALELASAWLRTLTPIEIADEIARGLDAFERVRRDVPKRHAGMRAVFEHSWALMTPSEQKVMGQVSVFRGGMTREAAHDIAGATLPLLSALVDKSLVKRAAGNRFRLHELVRQFASEQLNAGGDGGTDVSARHAHYFLTLLARRGQVLNGEQARDTLAELRRETENIRVAWQWAVEHLDIPALAHSTGALGNFYQAAGLLQEGAVLFRETLAGLEDVASETTTALKAEAYAQLAWLDLGLAAYPQAIAAAERAMELGRAAGAVSSEVMGEWVLGDALDRHTRDPRALTHFEHARERARQAELPILEAQILLSLAAPWQRHFTPQVTGEMLAHALALAEAQGEQRLTSTILINMAQAANHQGKLAEAEHLLERALALKRRLGDAIGEMQAYLNLGTLAVFQYQLDKAQNRYRQAVTLANEVGALAVGLHALVNLGSSKMVAGAYDEARHDYLAALTGGQTLGDRWAVQNALWGLLAVENAVGTPGRVLEFAQQKFTLAVSNGDEYESAFARLGLAFAWEALGEITAAETLYLEAIEFFRQRGERDDALPGVAGLARLALARDESTAAHALVSELVEALTAKLPAIDMEPLRLYLTGYEIFRACGDVRAPEVLRAAHAQLQKNAAAIQDDDTRTSYLENIPWHREIQRLYTAE